VFLVINCCLFFFCLRLFLSLLFVFFLSVYPCYCIVLLAGIMVLYSLTFWQMFSCGLIERNHRSGDRYALSHVIKSGSIMVDLKDGVKSVFPSTGVISVPVPFRPAEKQGL